MYVKYTVSDHLTCLPSLLRPDVDRRGALAPFNADASMWLLSDDRLIGTLEQRGSEYLLTDHQTFVDDGSVAARQGGD